MKSKLRLKNCKSTQVHTIRTPNKHVWKIHDAIQVDGLWMKNGVEVE